MPQIYFVVRVHDNTIIYFSMDRQCKRNQNRIEIFIHRFNRMGKKNRERFFSNLFKRKQTICPKSDNVFSKRSRRLNVLSNIHHRWKKWLLADFHVYLFFSSSIFTMFNDLSKVDDEPKVLLKYKSHEIIL